MGKDPMILFPKQVLPIDFDWFDLKPILEKLQSFSLQNAYSKPIEIYSEYTSVHNDQCQVECEVSNSRVQN